jgi:small subunit ribosomal protein S4
MLNGKRVDVPSIRLKPGDKLSLREASKKTEYFKQIDELSPAPGNIPAWLKVNRKQLSVEVSGFPSRDDAEPDIKEQLIVEYYSR